MKKKEKKKKTLKPGLKQNSPHNLTKRNLHCSSHWIAFEIALKWNRTLSKSSTSLTNKVILYSRSLNYHQQQQQQMASHRSTVSS